MPQKPMLVGLVGGTQSALGISANTLVFSGPCTLFGVSITTAGTGPGLIHDAASLADILRGDEVVDTPATVGPIAGISGWPLLNGLVVSPGPTQIISVFYRPGIS